MKWLEGYSGGEVKIDAVLAADMQRIAAEAQRLEALGYDGLRLAELAYPVSR